MAENSAISWTDHTFNPWVGCTKVGPPCDHCYAEAWGQRFGVEWGPGKPRRRTAAGNWAKVYKWHREADAFFAVHGRYPRVFAASLADIFDNEVDPQWRADFFDLVRATPKLIWLIVTKRIGNAAKMLPEDWGDGWANVILISTVASQDEADRDTPKLLRTPATRRGLSIEPMLGPMNISAYLGLIDWVIVGGESRQLPGSRPLVDLELDWVRDIRDQCIAFRVPFHFKQWGYTIPQSQVANAMPANDNRKALVTIKTPVGPRLVFDDWMGRDVDGREWNEFPEAA